MERIQSYSILPSFGSSTCELKFGLTYCPGLEGPSSLALEDAEEARTSNKRTLRSIFLTMPGVCTVSAARASTETERRPSTWVLAGEKGERARVSSSVLLSDVQGTSVPPTCHANRALRTSGPSPTGESHRAEWGFKGSGGSCNKDRLILGLPNGKTVRTLSSFFPASPAHSLLPPSSFFKKFLLTSQQIILV